MTVILDHAEYVHAQSQLFQRFYGGTGMRYLRLTIESGSSSVSSLAELGVYISE